jgi:FkbM family methyltransferase
MKPLRIGRASFDMVGSGDHDRYFDALVDGIHDDLDRVCAALLTDSAGVILDVGANIGTTSAIFSQHVPDGQVYAFEPGPNVFAALQANVATNGLSNVKPFNLAVAAKPGTIRFAEDAAFGHIVSDCSGCDVAAVSIDDFVRSSALKRVDLIKIDVEGFERGVLEGAVETIERFAPIVHMEFNLWCLMAYAKVDPIEFAESLVSTFRFVFAIDSALPDRARRIEAGQAARFVHDRLAACGCIDDLILTNSEQVADVLESLVITPPVAEIVSTEHHVGWRQIAAYTGRRLALHAQALTGSRNQP